MSLQVSSRGNNQFAIERSVAGQEAGLDGTSLVSGPAGAGDCSG